MEALLVEEPSGASGPCSLKQRCVKPSLLSIFAASVLSVHVSCTCTPQVDGFLAGTWTDELDCRSMRSACPFFFCVSSGDPCRGSEMVPGCCFGCWLCSCLTAAAALLTPLVLLLQRFDELLQLASKGQHTSVDMLVKDIYGGSYASLGLTGDLIASSFGKSATADRGERWRLPPSAGSDGQREDGSCGSRSESGFRAK